MPAVPYRPFSTVSPTGGGERIAVQTPGASFGENIGAALRQLGTTTEQAGGELFQRAIALQDLANENAARDGQTQFALKASQLHADYGALTGKAAKDALPKFLQDQSDLRQSIRGSLTSPMAQRMYDADTLPFMQRNVFSAAAHAAEENKKYTLETLNSSSTLNIQAAAQHPDDENFVNQQRAKIQDSVQTAAFIKYGTQDPNDPNVVKDVSNALSEQRAEQILGKAKTDPVTAGQWMERYGDDLTNPVDRDRVQGVIENKGAAIAGSNIASSVLGMHRQADGTFDATAKQMEDEVRAKATQALPDNKLLPDTAVGKLQSLLWHENFFAKQEQADAKQQFNATLAKGDIKDVQQLISMPGMDKIIPKLPPDLRTAPQLQGYINRFYAAQNQITNERAARMINGLKNNDAAGFMAIDPTDPQYHLSKSDIIRVQNEQAEMARNPKDDPRVSRALNWIKGARASELQALGIATRDRNNPDDYDHFTGALQESLQIWQQDHNGKPPSYEDIVDKIAPTLIKTQATNKGWLWNSQEPAFKQYERPTVEDIPEDFRQKLNDDVVKAGGAAPSDQQVVQAYARMQFNKLYKKAQPSE